MFDFQAYFNPARRNGTNIWENPEGIGFAIGFAIQFQIYDCVMCINLKIITSNYQTWC